MIAGGNGGECSPTELREKFERGDRFLLLDVRTVSELQTAALPYRVTHIPLTELAQRLSELEDWRNEEIVVLCHHGGRSAVAQCFLRKNGFAHVKNLRGGINAYALRVDASIPRY